MGLTWGKQLSVGNEIIDAEHRNLIGMVNDIVRAIRARDCDALAQAFQLLEGWLCVHFVNKEKIARAVNFDFSNHKSAQQYLLKELQHMRDELIAKNGMWSDGAVDHFTRSLKVWMIDGHIIDLDMLMKPALQAHDYKFWTGQCDNEAGHAAKADYSPMLATSSMDACGCGCGCDNHSPAIKKPVSPVFTKLFSAYPS